MDSDSSSSFSGFDSDDIDNAEVNLDEIGSDGDLSDFEVSSVSSLDSDDSFIFDPTDENEVQCNPSWTKNYQPVHIPPFNQPTGHTLPHNFDTINSKEVDYFMLYFDEKLFQTITENTNAYAKWQIQRKRITNPNYTDKKWTEDLTVADMKAYIGLSIIFGLNPRPRYKMYWSSDPFLGNDGVKATMTKADYEKISEYLHVSNRESELERNHPNYDPLQKVRPLLDQIDTTFPKYMLPTREQTIDEGMISFTGRFFARQFLPNKPHRYKLISMFTIF